ncbi:uncharacterized protein LOC134163689 [Pezoporus occidentalis]|uniref:uncharacterized protein LOC134163689 n=1 Tax=Pezoporus occidentalis TaxID=407982 RepID=UPI002F9165B8
MDKDMVRKAKAHLELNLAGNRKGNKKDFYRFIISRRNIREKVGLLLKVSSGIVNKDMERPERKEAAAEQREKTAGEPSPAEEPSPAAEPSPATAEPIPRKPPAEPQEDAGDHAAFPSKAEEEDLDSGKEKLVVGEPASTAATPAPVTSTAASFESSEGFEWPLGTLGTCLLIVMGISMLAHIQTVFYPPPFCLISEVKQSQVWVLSAIRRRYGRTRRFSPRLDSHEWQGVWDSMGKYLVHWAPPLLWKSRRWKAAVWSPQQQTAETA